MTRVRGSPETRPKAGWRRPARWLLDGVLLAAAAGLLLQRSGPLRDAVDGWVRQRSLQERAASRWDELTGGASKESAGGADRAEPLLVEFTDYRCPFCRHAQPALDSLGLVPEAPGRPASARTRARAAERFPYALTGRRVVRHLPIASLHPDASDLARVSVCAEADPAFPEVHRALYDAPSPAPDGALIRLLADAGVAHPETVLRCAREAAAEERIRGDLRLAAELGLRATPTFLARSAVHEGTLSVERLREMLRLPPEAARPPGATERLP